MRRQDARAAWEGQNTVEQLCDVELTAPGLALADIGIDVAPDQRDLDVAAGQRKADAATDAFSGHPRLVGLHCAKFFECNQVNLEKTKRESWQIDAVMGAIQLHEKAA